MVLSKINKDVSYPELKSVDSGDIKMEANLYQLEILGSDVIIDVGNLLQILYKIFHILCMTNYMKCLRK
jgi:hypothetical protein